MASLGNIGLVKRTITPDVSKLTFFAWEKQVSVVATVTGGTANEFIVLMNHTYVIQIIKADGSGDGTFYDLEDGLYYAHGLDEADHMWKIEVAVAVVTVTDLTPTGGGGGGSGKTYGHAFIGT